MPGIAEAVDALHLEVLDGARGEFRIRCKLLSDLLDQLAGHFDVGIVGEGHSDLLHDPVSNSMLSDGAPSSP